MNRRDEKTNESGFFCKALNGPLQERMTTLDNDKQITLEDQKVMVNFSSPDFLRLIVIFNQIFEAHHRINSVLKSLTAILNEHFILGQSYLINSSQTFFSLNKTTSKSLSNYQLSLTDYGHINISSTSIHSSSTILVRVICF